MQLSIEQYATLFNATAVGIVLSISMLAQRRFPNSFFRSWTNAYLCSFLILLLELSAAALGRRSWLGTLEVSLIALNALWLLQTAKHRTGRPLDARALWGLGIAVSLLPWAGLAAGLPYLTLVLLPALALAVAFAWLGLRLLRPRLPSTTQAAHWLGLPLIAVGAWILTYAWIGPSVNAWIGYWVSGLLNLWVGIGMMAFLLFETADELASRNVELLKTDEFKTNFLNSVSHEIRTPLTAIKAAASFMPEATEEQLVLCKEIVVSNANRLNRMLGDVLDLARVEAGALPFEKANLDLGDLAVRARDMFGPLMRQTPITFSAEIDEAPIPVCVDGDRLMQVLSNLLSNAQKFTPAGGTVSLWTGVRDGKALIVVKDSGVGIAPELLDKVFERFFQVDGTSTRARGGTGLGLAISKAIVEEGHGGRLWARSSGEGGSEFIVELPLAAPVRSEAIARPA